jgi:predicted nuclease of predicted toxin-antitoxin system
VLLIDENLSHKLAPGLQKDFPGTLSVTLAPGLGVGADDANVWAFAKTHGLAILTKDKDFVEYWRRFGPPPKVVRLDICNCRVAALRARVDANRARILAFLQSPTDGLLVI